MPRKIIGTSWDRDSRNSMNGNFEELYNVQDRAISEATQAVIDYSKLIWQEPVETYNDIAAVYPNSEVGYTVMARDTGKVYRYDVGGFWKEIQDIDPTAINEVDTRLTAQLAQIATNVRQSQSVLDGVTDDTISLQTLLDSMTTDELLISNCIIKISGELIVPKGVKITGKNATIIFDGRINLSGDNELTGLVFDGLNTSNYIPFKLNGDNITIKNCTFKNFKTSTPNMETNVLFAYANNILIEGNTFDTIAPDDITGIARAIQSNDSDGLIIKENTFKNMTGLKDSDYIVIKSNGIEASYFPFSSAPTPVTNVRYLTKKAFVLDNIFYQTCKSSIKIQSSGVLVKNNTIYVSSVTTTEVHSCIRVYSSSNIIIQNNNIFVDVDNFNKVIEVMYSIRVTITSNKISFTSDLIESTYSYYKNYGVTLDYCEHVTIDSNDFNMRNMTGFVYALCVKRSNITKNNVSLNQTTRTQCNNFYITGTGLIKSEFIVIENNVFSGDTQTLTFIHNSNTLCKNNTLLGNVILQDSDLINIYSNKIGNKGTLNYLLECHLSCSNIDFISNEFNTLSVTYPIRLYNTITNLKFINNLIYSDYSFEFFNVDPTQNMVEITYIPGARKSKRLDYGSTGERPDITLNVGHNYFDTTLNKPITWNGTAWVDSSGATA